MSIHPITHQRFRVHVVESPIFHRDLTALYPEPDPAHDASIEKRRKSKKRKQEDVKQPSCRTPMISGVFGGVSGISREIFYCFASRECRCGRQLSRDAASEEAS